ncbi:MAG: hypothetical protein J6T60_00760 [Bacteroidales bacterium]|nr:hypothetical protein [Bacteroidales bacterium]
MYSRELEELIANCIQDGMIDESERLAIINRAQREGVDINEINVVLKNRLQQICMETYAMENAVKKCPNCGEVIPPGKGVCPSCNYTINLDTQQESQQLRAGLRELDEVFLRLQMIKPWEVGFSKVRLRAEQCMSELKRTYGDNKDVRESIKEKSMVIEKKAKNRLIFYIALAIIVLLIFIL